MGVTFVTLLVLGTVVTGLLVMGASRPGSILLTVSVIAATIFVVGIVLFAYGYAPKGYRIDETAIRVERPAGDVVIPLSRVVDVKPVDAFLGLSLKSFPGGNSGLFGLYGSFTRRDLGKYQMYARAATNAVLVQTQDGDIVLAPHPRDAFVAAVRDAIGERATS